MSWVSVSFPLSSTHLDTVSDALFALGALSLSIEDAHSGTALEQPIYREPTEVADDMWRDSRVHALFAEHADVDAVLEALRLRIGWPVLPAVERTWVGEEDWVRKTQAQFAPIQISPRLWITPSWCDAPAGGAVNVWLDPGLAFGTGSHPTTALCLRWLDQANPKGFSVLDYGCGSGILAIAARKLGAKRVVGIDVDEQALQASRENAVKNGVDTVCFYAPDALAVQPFDIVIANILTNPLRTLAPLLAAYAGPQAQLVLSGILLPQVAAIQAAYMPWFTLTVVDQCDGWACLAARKRMI